MQPSFWRHVHGGSTHLPIVLLLASVLFDLIAWRSRDETLRRGLHAAGFGSAIVGLLGGLGAVLAGLALTHGRIVGGGWEKFHHLFVWPAFGLSALLVGWRIWRGGRILSRFGIYLAGLGAASMLMLGAGYSGGEMLLAAESDPPGPLAPATRSALPAEATDQTVLAAGQKLFLKNCAHCHGADARGDEGPDLHHLDGTDERLIQRIRNGKRGQMPAFRGKL